MRNLSVPAVTLLAFSCFFHAGHAQAETFSFTASGYDVNTGITLSISALLSGTADTATTDAYDLTSGSGTLTITQNGTTTTDSVTLYIPSGTSTSPEDVSFSSNVGYMYDNVLYPQGTQENGAEGAVLDMYGLLFSSSDNHYNFFGENGYGYIDDSTQEPFSSPIQSISFTDVTGVTPEPSSIALLGTGLLGGLTALRRRRAC